MMPTHTAIYSQSTGEFSILSPVDDGGIERVVFEARGYSGRAIGRNNPDAQHIKNTGPIPRGQFLVTGPTSHGHAGKLVFRLWPTLRNEMFGRSGFLIHGDNPEGDASKGCIILARAAREKIAEFRVKQLHVTG